MTDISTTTFRLYSTDHRESATAAILQKEPVFSAENVDIDAELSTTTSDTSVMGHKARFLLLLRYVGYWGEKSRNNVATTS